MASNSSEYRSNVSDTSSPFLLRNLGLLRRDPRLPSVCRRHVLVQWARLPFLAVKVLSVRAAGNGVVIPEQTPPPQLGQQQVDDVLERLREEGVRLRSKVSLRHLDTFRPPTRKNEGGGRKKGEREKGSAASPLTKLKPSTSASLIHTSSPSATCAAVPTRTGPLPPMLTCSAIVCFVHLAVPGENRA
ncbi:hypothetical protein CGRA01v4_10450 [Colletotrichum graminicola]|nr:hypothetical protein CGRA01v4_10450 [Colletotrichum graminicola]